MAGEMAKQIGERIRQARLEAGFHRQRDLADKIDDIAREQGAPVPIDNQRVSDWERGVNKPNDRYMALLAQAVNRDVGWFYGRVDLPVPDLSLIQWAAKEEQVDGGFEEFRTYVSELHEHIGRLEERVDSYARERDEHVAEIKDLLREQSGLLKMIRQLVGVDRVDVEGEEVTLLDHLVQLVQDTAARDAASDPAPRRARSESS